MRGEFINNISITTKSQLIFFLSIFLNKEPNCICNFISFSHLKLNDYNITFILKFNEENIFIYCYVAYIYVNTFNFIFERCDI